MGRKRKSAGESKKPKKVRVKLLKREHAGQETAPYTILDELIDLHHDHLTGAKFAILWWFDVKADENGIVPLGKVSVCSDEAKAAHGFDFSIRLNHQVWNSAGFTEEMMRIKLDELLCFCEVQRDKDGEPKEDDNGRTVYRRRGPDVKCFKEILKRHGAFSQELEDIATILADEANRPLFAGQEKPAGKSKPDLKVHAPKEKAATA